MSRSKNHTYGRGLSKLEVQSHVKGNALATSACRGPCAGLPNEIIETEIRLKTPCKTVYFAAKFRRPSGETWARHAHI